MPTWLLNELVYGSPHATFILSAHVSSAECVYSSEIEVEKIKSELDWSYLLLTIDVNEIFQSVVDINFKRF